MGKAGTISLWTQTSFVGSPWREPNDTSILICPIDFLKFKGKTGGL